MHKYFWAAGLVFLACSCSPVKSTSEDERHQAELSLHEVQTKVDDFEHDLSCYKTEFQILEAKLDSQQSEFAALQEKVQKDYQEKVDSLTARLQELETRNAKMEKQTTQALASLKELAGHAEKTSLALSQYRGKINELQNNLAKQNLQMEEIKQIKSAVEEMAKVLEDAPSVSFHRVCKGESLEKIAKKYGVSINSLKKINRLDEDLIMVGQELKIPSQ